ncbi:hypothetical protein MW887_003293 [Aspergillus wentii]|nr:hypothetical protein MW887_003293 [Aspergillus wentii]
MPSIELSEVSPPSSTRKDMLRLEKSDSEYFEQADEEKQKSFSDIAADFLSQTHQDYLIQRHGTLELDPIPSMSDADPYNWPTWKKLINLILVAFHACMGTFTAASIIPAYETIAEDLGVSLQRASYLTSLQIAILGGAPLLWKPLSNRFGRRPVFLLSTILRPFIFGFVAYRVGYRWIFWVLAMTNAAQFILYIFFGPETRYLGGSNQSQASDLKAQYFSFHRIDPSPLRLSEFFHPLALFMKPTVLIPAVAYAMVFLFGSVLITVEVPQLLQAKFGLNTQQLGLQFLGVIIGSVLGEQVGGSMSDFWMNHRARKIQQRPEPEYRLWLSYPGTLLAIAGTVVFLVCTEQAPGHWVVPPIIGTGISAFGNQIVTTVMITYAVDSYPQDAGSVGVFITFVRQIWGFIGPFWFPDMFDTVGVAASSGIACALLVVFSLLLTIPVHAMGRKWRASNKVDQ